MSGVRYFAFKSKRFNRIWLAPLFCKVFNLVQTKKLSCNNIESLFKDVCRNVVCKKDMILCPFLKIVFSVSAQRKNILDTINIIPSNEFTPCHHGETLVTMAWSPTAKARGTHIRLARGVGLTEKALRAGSLNTRRHYTYTNA